MTITGPTNVGLPSLTIHGWKLDGGFFLLGSRIFTVGEGRTVTLLNLRMVDGAASSGDPNGGLIKVLQSGRLTIRGGLLAEGSASADGGGIWSGPNSQLTITGTEILDNVARQNGGGIAFSGDTLAVKSTYVAHVIPSARIIGNEAGLDGGGVWVSGTGNATSVKIDFERVLVDGNKAGESGGGLYLTWGATARGVPVQLTDVEVQGNEATRNFAGGIFVRANTRMIRGYVIRNTARQPEAGIYDSGNRFIPVGDPDIRDNSQIEAQPQQEPTDPIPPTAIYIGADAEALLSEASIRADGTGATYFWNDGLLEISSSEDARDCGWSEFVGNYTQTSSGSFGVDLDNATCDQFQISGSGYQVTLAGGLALDAHWTTPPAYGTVYTIIKNDTDQYTAGTFAGLPDGTEFWLEGAKLRINYGVYMGDFNDVILTVVTTGTVSGTVWWDEDADGIHDPEETNTSYGWVALFDQYGNMVACTSVNMDGSYAFTDVIPGQYVLYASQASFVPSPEDQGGDDEYDSDVNASGYSDPFTLLGGQTVDLDVGMVYFV